MQQVSQTNLHTGSIKIAIAIENVKKYRHISERNVEKISDPLKATLVIYIANIITR